MSTLIISITAVDFTSHGEPKLTGPDYFRVAADNARAQAAEVRRVQTARELRECLRRFRQVRDSGQSGSHAGLEDALQRDSQGDVRHTLPAQDANQSGHDPVGQIENAGGERHADADPNARTNSRASGASLRQVTNPARQQDLAATGKSAAEGGGAAPGPAPATEVE